jgi:hypothetical protein
MALMMGVVQHIERHCWAIHIEDTARDAAVEVGMQRAALDDERFAPGPETATIS